VVGVAPGPEAISGTLKCDEVIYLTDNAAEVGMKFDRFMKDPQKKKNRDRLTSRETDILKLVAQGRSNKEIADILFISVHTVISHRKHITEKLNIRTIAGLTLYAVINNLTD
jgi:DNA-binding CsgD family transcriptional regulator